MPETLQEKQTSETSGISASDTPNTGGSLTMACCPIDSTAESKLLLKLDFVIWPVFFIIYMMSFLDRINISNARIQGMAEDLDLSRGSRFNVALFVRLSKHSNTESTKR